MITHPDGSVEFSFGRKRPTELVGGDPDSIREVVSVRWKLAEELSARFLKLAIEEARKEGVTIHPVATVDVWCAKTVLATDRREWHVSTLAYGLTALIRDRVDRRLNEKELLREMAAFQPAASRFWQENIEIFAEWQRTCARYGLDLRARAVTGGR